MRNISRCLAITVVIVFLGAYANAAVATQTQTQGDKAFQGTLMKVDADTRILTVKDAEGNESYFSYTDDTKVVGPTKDVEGLMGKPGATLRILYRVEGAANRATRIEVLP